MGEAIPLSPFAKTILANKYLHPDESTWGDVAERVTTEVMAAAVDRATTDRVRNLIERRGFMPAGRFLYAAGRNIPQTNNCFLLRAEDSREGWADVLSKSMLVLSTGGGVGIDYGRVRPSGSPVRGMGGEASGPLPLMRAVNEVGRSVIQGGSRRSALWAGLPWWHPDVFDFMAMKDWSESVRDAKAADFDHPAEMDGTNVSVQLDDDFFAAYHEPSHPRHDLAREVYGTAVELMCRTGEPGFSVDVGDDSGETLRNPCTEISSHDDSDVCCLGSLNMARFDSLDAFREAVRLGTLFLICGTMYSAVPYPEVAKVRARNRRIGLGLMGIHEWLAVRGKPYGPDDELAEWLAVYRDESDAAAESYAEMFRIATPVKRRAIAPTGTISIIGETTSGIEPVFAVAFKRRYYDKGTWRYQYVVDAAAERMIARGADPHTIEASETAYALAPNVERRVAFQSFVQDYVDHAISSTVNLPAWGSEHNNEDTVDKFGAMLMQYLPTLRGITVYPDGSRGGQPLTVVPYEEAAAALGVEHTEHGNENACGIDGVCGA